jgi:hypothetical protein
MARSVVVPFAGAVAALVEAGATSASERRRLIEPRSSSAAQATRHRAAPETSMAADILTAPPPCGTRIHHSQAPDWGQD